MRSNTAVVPHAEEIRRILKLLPSEPPVATLSPHVPVAYAVPMLALGILGFLFEVY